MAKRQLFTSNIPLLTFYFLTGCIVLFIAVGEVTAESKIIKDKGELTSVEEDGTVIIDEKGYEIDPSVKVIDKRGKKTTIHGIYPPARVYFEYEYARKGFVIKLIEEFPENLPE